MSNSEQDKQTVPVPNSNDSYLPLEDMELVYEVEQYDLGPPYGRRFR